MNGSTIIHLLLKGVYEMALPIHQNVHFFFFFFFFMLFIPFHNSQNYPPFSVSHFQTLFKLQHLLLTHLNLPITATTTRTDFCDTSIALANSNRPNPNPNPSLTLVCYHNNITQLHITGQYLNNNNVLVHPPTLPPNFSTASFVSALTSGLPDLKVLSLVSLGLRGSFPGAIIATNLPSLEILNVSSNHFTGNLPIQISCLHNLQTLILDHNCFTGAVPNWLSSLPLLTVASFKNNSLSGSLPNSLSGLSSLRILVVATNHLSGDLPSGFSNLTNLQVIDLEDNNFGPHFPILHNKLISLVLRRNSFRFGIPDEYLKSFYQLQKLDISANEFKGPFSPSLLSLPSLTYLDISGNKFSGMLFRNASCSDQLAFVNLSSNRLTGDLPRCLHGSNSKRVVYYDGNCLSSREHNLQQRYPCDSLCHDGALAVRITPQGQKRKRSFRKTVFAAGIAGGIVGGITLFSMVLLVVRRGYISNTGSKTTRTRLILEQNSPGSTIKMLTDARYISETMKLGQLGTPPYRAYALEEVKEATNNFHASTLIGNGSHGTLYRGQLTDGTLVAIRSIAVKKRHSNQTYTHQIELISKLRHCHLVSAIGHCFDCYPDDSRISRIFLLFEYLPNGTLRGSISGSGQKFTWTHRLAAAIGVARGIQFLHTGIVPGIFSNDIKIIDVLLDTNLHVKISRYNLPLLTEIRGMGAAGVPSMESKESTPRSFTIEGKDDVYDLGVILLEIIVGRAIISHNDCSIAKDLVHVSLGADIIARKSIVDPAVHKECSDESLKTLMELCIRCLCSEPSHRPSIEDVLWNLQFASQIQNSSHGNSQSESNHGSPDQSCV